MKLTIATSSAITAIVAVEVTTKTGLLFIISSELFITMELNKLSFTTLFTTDIATVNFAMTN